VIQRRFRDGLRDGLRDMAKYEKLVDIVRKKKIRWNASLIAMRCPKQKIDLREVLYRKRPIKKS
jgi:hypothetical protein